MSRLRESALAGSGDSWAAFVALAHSAEEDALDALIEACDSTDGHVRRAAVEGIGVHAAGRRAASIVLRMLRDDSDVVQRAACLAAATLGLDEARDALHDLRRASYPPTREAAVRSLGDLWRDADFEVMVEQFRSDPSDEVRRAVAWTLKLTAGRGRAARLFELWRCDALPRHRAWACELAAEYPDRSRREALVELAADGDGHVRRKAARAMAVLDGPA